MSIEGKIRITTSTKIRDEVVTETFELAKKNGGNYPVLTSDSDHFRYFMLGSVMREDLARILIPTKDLTTEMSMDNIYDNRGKYEHTVKDPLAIGLDGKPSGSKDITIATALRFFREDATLPFECTYLSPDIVIGDRLVLADAIDGLIRDSLGNLTKGRDYTIAYIGDIQEYSPATGKNRFKLTTSGQGIESFTLDEQGNYELRIRSDNTTLRYDFVLVNLQNPNEIYFMAGTAFSRTTHPVQKVEIVNGGNKVRKTYDKKGERLPLPTLYNELTRVLDKGTMRVDKDPTKS